MRYPKPLIPGDNARIQAVATSFGITTEPYASCYANALLKLGEEGYEVETDAYVTKAGEPFLADRAEDMGARFQELYLSDDAPGTIVSVAGGELMCDIIPHIDFEELAQAEPKWFMGFSDNTNLAFLMPTLCDVAAVYGPCFPEFGMEPWHPVLDDALQALMTPTSGRLSVKSYGKHQGEKLRSEDNPYADYNATEPNELVYLNTGADEADFSGRLLGGCLDVLASLPGTPYDNVANFAKRYSRDGIVWMLEPCDLNVLDIHRALWQLRQAGWFDSARGFVFGRAPLGEPIGDYGYERAVLDAMGPLHVPIILDADLGHIPPSMPFVEGAYGSVAACGNGMSVTQVFV